MKFEVINKETGNLVSPINYYFVIKQNGELYTINYDLSFTKADSKYEIVSERQTITEVKNKAETKPLIIADVNNLAKFSKMIANQKNCPPEFADIVNKEFWNLI